MDNEMKNILIDQLKNFMESEDFKGLLTTLNFKFPDLIKSVEVQSLEAFKKTIDQLNSPLCNKEKTIAEVINAIKNI